MASRAAPRRLPPARLVDRRIRLLLGITIVAFALVVLRAAYLGVVVGGQLDALAQGQQRVVVPLTAERGAILDREGRSLARSEPAVTVGAYTHLVQEPAVLAQQLAPILGVDATTLAHRLSDRSHTYVDLVRGVSTTTVARLKRHHIGQGVLGFIPGDRRVYPQGDIGAQVLGLTGTNGQGLAGAELSLDHLLGATEGQQVVVRDLDGRLLRVVSDHPGVPGRDVQLTLDRDIQATVERTVAATQARWHARWATAVVMDPRTGGILGMASAPGLPAGGYAKGTFGQQRMRTLADQYEPGSTFKAVTIGAALAEGAVTPTTRFLVPDAIKRYDKTVHDAHAHLPTWWTTSDILALSSNVGTITIAEQRLGARRFDSWTHRLGFGRLTGVDLPGEAPGAVLPLDQWSGTSILNIPIGEGIAVTPLQMAALYAGIADGGVWHEPHVVDRVLGGATPHVDTRRMFPAGVDNELVAMLRRVVEVGTGQEARIPGYSVAGKTGTTQKVDPKTGKYCGQTGKVCQYDSSFVGFVPAHHPRLVVLVVVDEPHGGYYGGVVAVPAFNQIATDALQTLGVPPDQP